MSFGSLTEEETTESCFLRFSLEMQKKLTNDLKNQRKKVLVLAGPTAVGKSALALRVADKIGGEIVSCDSMQIYRGMNIGTAKPSLEEQLQTPHHMIDLCDLHETFSVVDYFREARFVIDRIHERNNIPIVVGGTGFYAHTLIYGPPEGPPPHPALRRELEKQIEQEGVDALYNRLKEKDPDYAATITIHDRQKIVRALEIIQTTGKNVSSFTWKQKKRPQKYDFRCWFLSRPKESLAYRIHQRCEEMVNRGLIHEVKHLCSSGLLENRVAKQSIGYRQVLDYLETEKTQEDFETFLEAFKQATRKYAKRQKTWFKREALFHWLDLDLHDPETAIDIILSDFECWNWEL